MEPSERSTDIFDNLEYIVIDDPDYSGSESQPSLSDRTNPQFNGYTIEMSNAATFTLDYTVGETRVKITEFVIPSYSNITTLRLENVSSVINERAILSSIAAGSRVRLVGIYWECQDATEIDGLLDILDTMRGLDENGHPADTRTEAQKHSLYELLKDLTTEYPDARILGHCELPHVAKQCPCFPCSIEYASLQPDTRTKINTLN